MHSPFTRIANGVWVFESAMRQPCLAIIKRDELLPTMAKEAEGDVFRLLIPPAYPGAKMGDFWQLTENVVAAKIVFEPPKPKAVPTLHGPPGTCQPAQMAPIPSVGFQPPSRPDPLEKQATRPEAPTKPDHPSPFEGKCTRPEGHPGECGKFSKEDIHLQSVGGKVVPSCLKPLTE